MAGGRSKPRGANAAGRLEWVGIRRARRGAVTSVRFAEIVAGRGIVGDHAAAHAGGKRQVTLVQHEHLPLIAHFAGVDAVDPASLRRNFVVSGVNLCALKRGWFRIGRVTFEVTGDCAPCRRMEETIGPGGFDAVCGHGGLTAVAHDSGRVAVGDKVVAVDGDAASAKQSAQLFSR